MGRRKANPHDQAELGNPGKRSKSKMDRAIAEADRRAAFLVKARGASPSESKPALFADPLLADANQVWNDYAPRLDRLHLLSELDVLLFATFCIYAAEFAAAHRDVLANGYSVRVKTISGDKMPRENPAVGRRDFAAKQMADLGAKFGLTPADRHRLLSAGAMAFDDETLFGRVVPRAEKAVETAPADGEEQPAAAIDHGSAIGTLAQFDSVPPGAKPN